MRAMKDSGVEWIGLVPTSWHLQRGKSLFSQRMSKGNEEETLLAATQKFGMYPQSLLEGVVQVKEDTDLQTFRTVHRNDYVISLRSFQGGFELSDYEGICSPAYQVFYNRSPIDYRYYKYLFKSDGFVSKMNSLTVGIREGKNILFSDFADSIIPIPPIDDQPRIANLLNTKCAQIDAVIEKQQQAIEKLKEYKQSIITETVTKGLDPTVPMKDSGVEWIGMIPEHWSTIKSRFAISKIGDIDHYMPNSIDIGIPYIMTGDLKERVSDIEFCNCKQVSLEDYQFLSRKIIPECGDVIFARYATIGTVCFVDVEKEFLVSYSCVVIKSDRKLLLGRYLFYYLKSSAFSEEIKEHINSNTQENIGIESLYKARIVLPPPTEQRTILDFLDTKCSSIDLVIKSKQTVIDALTAYKKSFIYEAVTGKLEV